MKLERTLIELTTLVDYGTRYLLDVKSAYDKGHDDGVDDGHCDIDMLSLGEFMEHTDMSPYDVLDYIDSYDVKDYVKDNFDVDDVYDDEDIEDRARDLVDNMSLNEILDIKDMSDEDVLDCLKNSSITDYVAERFNVDDVYDADEILNNMDIASITDYVSRKIAIEDMVKWR